MAKPTLKETFQAKLKAALAGAGDGPIRDLNGFIMRSITSEAELLECLWEWCIGFNDERPQEERAKHRGRQIGYSLFSRAIELAGPLNSLGGLVPRMARNSRDSTAETDHQYVIYAERWNQLSPEDRRRLEDLSRIKRAAQQAQRDLQTILSPLLKAYHQQNPGQRPTLQALYAFDPAENPALRKEFDAIVQSCYQSWTQFSPNRQHIRLTEKSLKELDTTFQRFSTFLGQKATDPLVVFQVLKWIREASGSRLTQVVGEKDFTTPPWSVIWHELYLDAAFHAVRMAVTKWNLLIVQRAGSLPPEDAAFFLSVHRDKPEQEKLAARLRWGLDNAVGFVEVTRVRRRHECFARHGRLDLLDEFETVELLNRMAAEKQRNPEAVRQRYIQVNSARDAFRDRYRVSQKVMDDFTIVWIEPGSGQPMVIVEFHKMDCVLFRTNQNGLRTLVENAFFKALARNAAALKVFLLAYLELIGLVADIATAGATGGFRRFAFELAKEWGKEKVVDVGLDVAGVDDPAVRGLVGASAGFLHWPSARGVSPAIDPTPAARGHNPPLGPDTRAITTHPPTVATPISAAPPATSASPLRLAQQKVQEYQTSLPSKPGSADPGRSALARDTPSDAKTMTGPDNRAIQDRRQTEGSRGLTTPSPAAAAPPRDNPWFPAQPPVDPPRWKHQQMQQQQTKVPPRPGDTDRDLAEVMESHRARGTGGAGDELVATGQASSRRTPGKAEPVPTEAGKFVHTNAEPLRTHLPPPNIPKEFASNPRVIPLSDLPDDLIGALQSTGRPGRELRLGVTSRVDRATGSATILDANSGIIYEIKPDTADSIRKGLKRSPEYVKLANANHKQLGGKGTPYRDYRVVVYNKTAARNLIR